jgi:hypothetical protein
MVADDSPHVDSHYLWSNFRWPVAEKSLIVCYAQYFMSEIFSCLPWDTFTGTGDNFAMLHNFPITITVMRYVREGAVATTESW